MRSRDGLTGHDGCWNTANEIEEEDGEESIFEAWKGKGRDVSGAIPLMSRTSAHAPKYQMDAPSVPRLIVEMVQFVVNHMVKRV